MSNSTENLSGLLGRKKTSVESTATFLVFEPGLYAINFGANSSSSSDVGLRLPSARLEVVPSPGSGEAFVSTTPRTGWISTDTIASHILVVGGRAGALLTIYRSSDAVEMPTVEFRAVVKSSDIMAAAAKPSAPVVASERVITQRNVSALSLTTHLQNNNQLTTAGDEWSAAPTSTIPIDGFEIVGVANGGHIEFEYQGVMGKNWNTPWFKNGEYCGSRGLQLPILGFRVKLSAASAKLYSLSYWGIFGGGDMVGPISAGCVCELGQQPLTSMKIVVSAKVPRKLAQAKRSAMGITESKKEVLLHTL